MTEKAQHFTPARTVPILLLTALSMAGCTSMSGLGGKSEFNCSAPSGVPCQSVSGVHANFRAGTLPYQRAGDDLKPPAPAADRGGRGAPAEAAPQAAAGPRRYADPAATAAVQPTGAIRSEPTIIRIWTAPWEDADGDLHDQAYMYLQIDAGRWLIEHNRAQIRRAFGPQVSLSGSGAGTPAGSASGRAAALPTVKLPEGDDLAAAAAKGAAMAQELLRGARMTNPLTGEKR